MLQQWDKRGKTEMIAARPREVKNLPRIQNRGRAGSESQATPDKAHTSLFAKQERLTRMKAQSKKGHFYMLSYSFFQKSQASSQEQNYYNIYSHPKQVTPTLIDKNEAFVLQKGQPLNGLPFSF